MEPNNKSNNKDTVSQLAKSPFVSHHVSAFRGIW
jgi:hypothetical protein